ncbi:unnamed protein product [Rhodiola kirilowii]
MATVKWVLLVIMLQSYCMAFSLVAQTRKTYIVHMDNLAKPESFSDHSDWYASLLVGDDDDDDKIRSRILYTYQTAFHGVAAQLDKVEAERLQRENGVLAVLPETVYHLHTTRSPTFLGLEPADSTSQWSGNSDVIVGVLDTGIWPESESFNDTGFSQPPSHWKGACETGRAFEKRHCNKKIVGARVFYRGYEAATGKINEQDEFKSPRDQDGHGTHTAATVAGSPVRGANLLGYATGTARGMAPNARIAAYKVCWTSGCFSSDILSAVDQAVADGVSVLSISLGGGVASYYRDLLSIATFGAMEKGVFVSCSAGNSGPDPISLTNVSPWVTTVGASTMDRDFPATVKLGNSKVFTGVSLYKGRRNLSSNRQYQLVYLGTNSTSPEPNSLCLEGTLSPKLVAGKIVICDRGISPRVQKGQVVKDAGGIGMILANTAVNGEELVADAHLLPAVSVGERAGSAIKKYVLTNPKATATMSFLGTRLGIKPSPIVASFSSRGPNFLSLDILKPDLVAPGVNILAAWTAQLSPSGLATDHRRLKFNILSGTSMSCPHVSGIGALLKSKHPEWSPAAIKSALMTTAYIHDNTNSPIKDAATGEPSTAYDHGAGHINPVRAIHPGLIYDITPQDYYDFLCRQHLSQDDLRVFTKSSNRTCRRPSRILPHPGELNYPALSALIFTQKSKSSTATLYRTVTNVGTANSTYHVRTSPFKGATVQVVPSTLQFTRLNQKLSYKVIFTSKSPRPPGPEFGHLLWTDGAHRVRSPVVITWPVLI